VEPGRQASGFQALEAITARRGNKCRGNVRPYGEGFGGREEEGGGDAEERTASGERNVENAGPPFHGGGEVAGALEREWMSKLGIEITVWAFYPIFWALLNTCLQRNQRRANGPEAH
jgi:hypothetical protein